MKIVKFGGSSLATGESVAQAIQIILSDPQRQVMVVSAPGKRNTTDIKVTDLLIKYADLALKHKNCVEIVNKIFSRYQEIGHYFGLADTELSIIKQILLEADCKIKLNTSFKY